MREKCFCLLREKTVTWFAILMPQLPLRTCDKLCVNGNQLPHTCGAIDFHVNFLRTYGC